MWGLQAFLIVNVLKITMVLFIIMVGFKLCIYSWHWSIFGILCFPLGLLQTLSFAHARTDKYKLCFSTVNLRTAYVVFLCALSYPSSFIYSQNKTNTKRFCMASYLLQLFFMWFYRTGCRPFIEIYQNGKRILNTAQEIDQMR